MVYQLFNHPVQFINLSMSVRDLFSLPFPPPSNHRISTNNLLPACHLLLYPRKRQKSPPASRKDGVSKSSSGAYLVDFVMTAILIPVEEFEVNDLKKGGEKKSPGEEGIE